MWFCHRRKEGSMTAAPKKIIKSASTGQFVTKEQAKRTPKSTVTQTTGQDHHSERHRSTATGQFVTEEYAEDHPRTTIKESGK
jgi:hypothetical protein